MSLPKESPKLKLYSYWRSSCSQRVRTALNLKGLEYEYIAVNLSKNEQSSPEFEKVNPIKCVPALVDGDIVVADSFAIILYLEDKYPEHSLLPQDPQNKTLNIQIASIVSSSIHPLSNLRSLKSMGQDINPDEKIALAQSHIVKGFTALEKLLKNSTGRYATGDEAQLADVFLAPQILKATKRFQVDMSPFPTLARLNDAYVEHPAFQSALPERQPDAVIAS